MSTATLSPTTAVAASARQRAVPGPIPFGRLLSVELRKMFDTRSGFWLMASVVILSLAATGAVILFAPESEIGYEVFASAIGIPMSVVLPMIAVLSVTSEWSQRTALTTFTLVPGRGRVIAAKFALTVAIGVASMLVAAAAGALGTLLGSAIEGIDPAWNVSVMEFARIILANVLGMLVGFMLGVVLRNSPGAIVGYFVYALVLPTISNAFSATQQWYADNAGWLDFNYAVSKLFMDAGPTGEEWVQIGVTGVLWLVIPMTIGVRSLLRSEIK